eukprot:CAMPEP_0177773606 /NCGR_PEP_ID=MMETSP0491_2-20121128/12972_1 /TAXON_ID=63592 /ORGANISM="Tetraselmis chuii, Strain PLY429" /LENGTH=150 /DNA_ID=CAMNT_0019291747 /DNA_START=199 /DNA_END=651 /DNA_ORIENTATION=-
MALLARHLAPAAAPTLSALLGAAKQSAGAQGAWQAVSRRWYAAGGGVIEVSNDEQYRAAIASGDMVVADFTAAWCGPCQKMAPFYEKLSVENPKIKFLKIDIDSELLQTSVQEEQISAVPTFVMYKDKKKVKTITGADTKQLKTAIADLL